MPSGIQRFVFCIIAETSCKRIPITRCTRSHGHTDHTPSFVTMKSTKLVSLGVARDRADRRDARATASAGNPPAPTRARRSQSRLRRSASGCKHETEARERRLLERLPVVRAKACGRARCACIGASSPSSRQPASRPQMQKPEAFVTPRDRRRRGVPARARYAGDAHTRIAIRLERTRDEARIGELTDAHGRVEALFHQVDHAVRQVEFDVISRDTPRETRSPRA